MTMIHAIAISLIFGAGAYLMLKHDLIRVVIGMVLISHASILFIMSAGLTRGPAPFIPILNDQDVSDPLVQAMALTAVVISFGVSALLLGIVVRVSLAHRTVDVDELVKAEGIEAARDDTPAPGEMLDLEMSPEEVLAE